MTKISGKGRVVASCLYLALALSLNGVPTASAQGLANALREHEPFQNLQVIDASISAADLAVTMEEIKNAVGSEQGCLFCHVGVSGQPLSTWDFASDAKEQKNVARVMLRMVETINAEFLSDLPGREEAAVTCRTCHASRPRPIPLEDLLLEAIHEEGAEAAVQRYRTLRERYYAADAYDFNEYVLRRLVSRIDPDKAEAKAAILRLNLEFFPESWRSLLGMGEAYLQMSQPELAEIFFERSLAIRVSGAGLEGLRRSREIRDAIQQQARPN